MWTSHLKAEGYQRNLKLDLIKNSLWKILTKEKHLIVLCVTAETIDSLSHFFWGVSPFWGLMWVKSQGKKDKKEKKRTF